MDIGQDARKHADRVDRGAAEQPGMQIAVGALDDHFLKHEATQHGDDGGRACVPHVGVADERDVGGKFFFVGVEEGRQRRATGFLLAFQQHGDRERQLAFRRNERAAGFDEGHQLAFVVGDAAGDDAAVAVRADETRLEGRRPPQFERVGRLHVVMAVE